MRPVSACASARREHRVRTAKIANKTKIRLLPIFDGALFLGNHTPNVIAYITSLEFGRRDILPGMSSLIENSNTYRQERTLTEGLAGVVENSRLASRGTTVTGHLESPGFAGRRPPYDAHVIRLPPSNRDREEKKRQPHPREDGDVARCALHLKKICILAEQPYCSLRTTLSNQRTLRQCSSVQEEMQEEMRTIFCG